MGHDFVLTFHQQRLHKWRTRTLRHPPPPLGGTNGAAIKHVLRAILSQIAIVHALKGRLRSGLVFRNHKTPIQIACAKNWTA